MTVTVPEPAPAASSWQLLDLVSPNAYSATADNAGTCTVRLPQVDADRMWQVTRCVIENTGAIVVPCRVYVLDAGQDPTSQFLRSGTNAGLFDEADYPGDGLWVPEGQQLVAQWLGVTAKSQSYVSVQYRLLGR